MIPYISRGSVVVENPMKRVFGRTGFEVTTLGLGGQASIQWTPPNVDPVAIILKAHHLGLNYFDTSNVYGPSQMHYGRAFRKLGMVPGLPGYRERARRNIFLTSKTHLRYAKGGDNVEGVRNGTNGPEGSKTLDDVRRSLSQMFGDGKGSYPADAYLDMVLIHSLSTWQELDAVYEGLDQPDPGAERIGALAALRDVRDGTNLTGLNPRKERLIRHIGFSGHYNPALMMAMIQRDKYELLDGMLVAINANDKLNFSMQNNVIPVAAAKNMGVIAMKVFADGAMYTKPAEWSNHPDHVVRTVGSPSLPSTPLVQYSLTTPGVHTAIIGIGSISDNHRYCQLVQNLASAQVESNSLSASDRDKIEKMASVVKNGKTNYFQMAHQPLSPPREVALRQRNEGTTRKAVLTWQTAYAGASPLDRYEVWRDGEKVGEVPFRPQTTMEPFLYEDIVKDKEAHRYVMKSVDKQGKSASSEAVTMQSV
jgi:aryl-alcohol dehydrogenase-like predicted oxidoreductase